MRAELLLRERHQLDEGAFAELRICRVPVAVPGSRHDYKYSLSYVVAGKCVLRYDNEAGKGDHKHVAGRQATYVFTTPVQLLADFWSDIERWQSRPTR